MKERSSHGTYVHFKVGRNIIITLFVRMNNRIVCVKSSILSKALKVESKEYIYSCHAIFELNDQFLSSHYVRNENLRCLVLYK